MKGKWAISGVFGIAAIYDGVLGVVFLFAPAAAFQWFAVTPPNHFGYVQFPAALLLVFGAMFAAVAIAPVRNRNLIPYGILMKVAYCAIVFYYWFTRGIPDMWKPFAIIDLIFIVLFIVACLMLARKE